jgi:predicted RNA-binding protein with PIN domain
MSGKGLYFCTISNDFKEFPMATLRIFIDGYNLAHKLGVKVSRERLQEIRQTLEVKILKYLSATKAEAVIVYDGRGILAGHGSEGRLKILYTQSGQTADSVIKTLIDNEKVKSRLVVVSSDREVSGYAKVSGVRTLTSEDFLGELEPAAPKAATQRATEKPPAPTTDKELEIWRKLFNV